MKRLLSSILVAVTFVVLSAGQTAVVTRNANLRSDASTNQKPITKLTPGTQIQVVGPDLIGGYYHVQTPGGQIGFVWGKNVQIQVATSGAPGLTSSPAVTARVPTSSSVGVGTPLPLLATGHPVDWWFVFKLNSAVFPGCGSNSARACIFGGTVQNYKAFGQQFVYASSEDRTLQQGSGCAGDTTEDPIGATFEEIYDNAFYYVIWNDQFYHDPDIQGCGTSCSSPWGHSKGMLAWNDSGEGLVLQVTTPSWPAAGNSRSPRKTDGNTLGCVRDNNVQVSQHFFALKLTKDDLVKVLSALRNASVVTDPENLQVVRTGGPAEVQNLVKELGTKSESKVYTKDVLSTGVQMISKPSHLDVPPWQLVSAVLGRSTKNCYLVGEPENLHHNIVYQGSLLGRFASQTWASRNCNNWAMDRQGIWPHRRPGNEFQPCQGRRFHLWERTLFDLWRHESARRGLWIKLLQQSKRTGWTFLCS